jgi:hypothetical protein
MISWLRDGFFRIVEYSPLADRTYYKNTVSGESCWTMPPAVKFYLPVSLENKVSIARRDCRRYCVIFVFSIWLISFFIALLFFHTYKMPRSYLPNFTSVK